MTVTPIPKIVNTNSIVSNLSAITGNMISTSDVMASAPRFEQIYINNSKTGDIVNSSWSNCSKDEFVIKMMDVDSLDTSQDELSDVEKQSCIETVPIDDIDVIDNVRLSNLWENTENTNLSVKPIAQSTCITNSVSTRTVQSVGQGRVDV